MMDYKKLIAGLLAATLVTTTNCGEKPKCNNKHIEDYYLETPNTDDDYNKATESNVISSMGEEFLKSTEIINWEYYYDSRIEAQFKKVDSLKFVDNMAIRKLLKKQIKDYERETNKKMTTKDLTNLLEMYRSESGIGTFFNIVLPIDNTFIRYTTLKNSLGYNNYLAYLSSNNLLTCDNIIKVEECLIEDNKLDYNTINSYILSGIVNEAELALTTIKDDNILMLRKEETTIYCHRSLTIEEANEIKKMMFDSVKYDIPFVTYIKNNKEIFIKYFNEEEFDAFTKTLTVKKLELNNKGTSV